MSVSNILLDTSATKIGATQMRAGVYRGAGRVAMEHVPVPEISDGEVLIRVAACGICGTDIKKIEHGFVAPPQIFGHEVAAPSWPLARASHVGTRETAWSAFIMCLARIVFIAGSDSFPNVLPTKRLDLQLVSTLMAVALPNTYAPCLGSPRVAWWKFQAGISFEEATFVEPVNTCLKAVEKARIVAGEVVLVIGKDRLVYC